MGEPMSLPPYIRPGEEYPVVCYNAMETLYGGILSNTGLNQSRFYCPCAQRHKIYVKVYSIGGAYLAH